MNRRWRWTMGAAVALAAAAWWFGAVRQGPVYEGKSAQAWLRELLRTEPARQEAAYRALDALGDQIIPVLRRELVCRDSNFERTLVSIAERLGWLGRNRIS